MSTLTVDSAPSYKLNRENSLYFFWVQREDACLSGAPPGSTRSSGALHRWAVAMADGPVLALWSTRAVSGGECQLNSRLRRNRI